MMQTYLIVSTMLLGFIGSVWSSSGALNILLKASLVCTALAGAVMIARTFGI